MVSGLIQRLFSGDPKALLAHLLSEREVASGDLAKPLPTANPVLAELHDRFASDHLKRLDENTHQTIYKTRELIVRRPRVNEREVLEEAQLDLMDGLAGDTWKYRASSRSADKK